MEVRDIIINEINNNTISSNYSEVFYNENGILTNIPKDKLFKIREINGLDKNTEISSEEDLEPVPPLYPRLS